jgi:hypothetical protein
VGEVTARAGVDDNIFMLPLPNPGDSRPVADTEDFVCELSIEDVIFEVLDFCVELGELRVVVLVLVLVARVLVLEVSLEVEEDSVSVLIAGIWLGRFVRCVPGVRGFVSNSSRSSWRQRIWMAGPTVACVLPVCVTPQTPPRKSVVSDVQVWPLRRAGSQFGQQAVISRFLIVGWLFFLFVLPVSQTGGINESTHLGTQYAAVSSAVIAGNPWVVSGSVTMHFGPI